MKFTPKTTFLFNFFILYSFGFTCILSLQSQCPVLTRVAMSALQAAAKLLHFPLFLFPL